MMILSSTNYFCTQRVQCLAAVLLTIAVVSATRDKHLHGARILHNACCNANRTRLYGIYTGSFTIADGWCDVTPDGQGWLVIMRRVRRNESTVPMFDKGLSEYEEGFGNLKANHEFWYGLQMLNKLTSKQQFELRVDFYNKSEDLQSFSHVTYSNFSIGSACEDYCLHIDNFQRGDPHIKLSDSLTQFNNQTFIGHRRGECNKRKGSGGWWYTPDDCYSNGGTAGVALTVENHRLHWYSEGGQVSELKEEYFDKYELKIRPKEC